MKPHDRKKLIAEYKRVELKAMGIDPEVFEVVVDFLNNQYSFIVKKKKSYIFIIGERKIKVKTDLIKEVCKAFSMDWDDAKPMVEEWERERKVYHHMLEDISLHWKFLDVTLMYGENFEEYDF